MQVNTRKNRKWTGFNYFTDKTCNKIFCSKKKKKLKLSTGVFENGYNE